MMWKWIALSLLALTLLVGVAGYSFLRTPVQASGPIQAVPLQTTDQPSSSVAPMANGTTVFEIDPDQSEARFIVDEVLRGQPNTAVGATDQVAGQIAVDPTQPQTAQVGTILINARTLTTDDNQRNNALRRFILGTDEHEFISFTPTAVSGLPMSASVGQAYRAQVIGQLAIRGVSREATFDTTVTPVSANELNGTATTTIRYADWDISIPQVPLVAGVSDQVRLELDFVASVA